jgi:hypothetical protein
MNQQDGTGLNLRLADPAEMVTEESEAKVGWRECLDSLGAFGSSASALRGDRTGGLNDALPRLLGGRLP